MPKQTSMVRNDEKEREFATGGVFVDGTQKISGIQHELKTTTLGKKPTSTRFSATETLANSNPASTGTVFERMFW